MRLPSFDEILIFDVRSFLIQRPYHMMLTKNCSDGGCQIHADVEFDWSTRQWLSPSIFPWQKREITPDEWKSKSYNSDRVLKPGFERHQTSRLCPQIRRKVEIDTNDGL